MKDIVHEVQAEFFSHIRWKHSLNIGIPSRTSPGNFCILNGIICIKMDHGRQTIIPFSWNSAIGPYIYFLAGLP